MILVDAEKVDIVLKPTVEGLPEGVCVEYFGEFGSPPTQFVVFRPEEDWDYADFRCLIGSAKRLSPVGIREVIRYRDGGTTEVKTEVGDFYFPTPWGKTGKRSVFIPRGKPPVTIQRFDGKAGDEK